MPFSKGFHGDVGDLVHAELEREGTLYVAMSLRLWAHAVETSHWDVPIRDPREPTDKEIELPVEAVIAIMATEVTQDEEDEEP